MDIGELGKYEFMRASGGRFLVGAVMPRMPEVPVTAWIFYFRVPEHRHGWRAQSDDNGGTD